MISAPLPSLTPPINLKPLLVVQMVIMQSENLATGRGPSKHIDLVHPEMAGSHRRDNIDSRCPPQEAAGAADLHRGLWRFLSCF